MTTPSQVEGAVMRFLASEKVYGVSVLNSSFVDALAAFGVRPSSYGLPLYTRGMEVFYGYEMHEKYAEFAFALLDILRTAYSQWFFCEPYGEARSRALRHLGEALGQPISWLSTPNVANLVLASHEAGLLIKEDTEALVTPSSINDSTSKRSEDGAAETVKEQP